MATRVREQGEIAVARSLMREGASEQRIRTALELDGLQDGEIDNILDYVRNQPLQSGETRNDQSDGSRTVLLGFVVFAIGAVITFFTYTAATATVGGGGYLVAWGAMLWGVITIVRGLFNRKD